MGEGEGEGVTRSEVEEEIGGSWGENWVKLGRKLGGGREVRLGGGGSDVCIQYVHTWNTTHALDGGNVY